MLVSVLAASVAVATVSACETRTPGYWKTHYPEAWIIRDITTDPWGFSANWDPPTAYCGFPGTAQGWEDLLNTPPKGDASIILAQKVIAAKLSIMADNRIGWDYDWVYEGGPMGGKTLPDLIADADAWLAAHTTCPPGTAGRAEGLALASAIDYWLNQLDVD